MALMRSNMERAFSHRRSIQPSKTTRHRYFSSKNAVSFGHSGRSGSAGGGEWKTTDRDRAKDVVMIYR